MDVFTPEELFYLNQATTGRDAADATPYAVIRRNHFQPATGSADAPTVAAVGGDFEQFQRLHAAQAGYHGALVVDTGNGVKLIVTVWTSEQHAAAARAALGPAIQRLLTPSMAAPSELLAAGEVISADFPTLRK